MLITKICENCGKEFTVQSWYGKGLYCSKECSNEAKKSKNLNATCLYCGKKFHIKPYHLHKYNSHYCSKECTNLAKSSIYLGEKNPNYGNIKNRLVVHNNGKVYYEIHVLNHPYSHMNKNIEVLAEHRYIVEQHYNLFDSKYFVCIDGKYYLKPEVHVHHKNEITTDNRIENLQPLTKSEHTSLHNKRKVIIRNPLNGKITGVVKQGELLETPEMGNQQPSQSLTTLEGSETNS